MNIFATYPCPEKSAQYLDNRRVIKMVLESAQMLSTSLHYLGYAHPYKPNHINHPCSIWARTTRANYAWLLEHMSALSSEYTYRYGKTHKCAELLPLFRRSQRLIPAGDLTSFANCSMFKELEVHEAYRKTMHAKWRMDDPAPSWKRRSMPDDYVC